MGTKNNPGVYDCYHKAEPDEPMFVLLARDELAPIVIRHWASRYIDSFSPPEDDAKVAEALACADAMEAWRRVNRDWETPGPERGLAGFTEEWATDEHGRRI